MFNFGYPEAVHSLFQLKLEVVLTSSISSWYLKRYHDPNNPIATVPIVVRIQKDLRTKKTKRAPWQPNNGDLHNEGFARKDGKPLPLIVFIQRTSAWAFDQLLRHGQKVRRVDWPERMHIRDVMIDGRLVIQLVLKNGKAVRDEFRPDFFDMDGEWEILQ